MPLLGNTFLAYRHQGPVGTETEPARVLTSHFSYSLPTVAQIEVKSLDKSTTHYSFNPFTFDSSSDINPVIYSSIGLSLNHHGTFEIQIEDSDKTLDTDLITNGKRVLIALGKTQDRMYTHLSGMIRTTGYTRGCENNLLYNISGFGSGIRLNERILDVLMDTPLLEDGSTVNQRDSNFFANRVVDDALDRTSYYPSGTSSSKVEGTGGLAYINSSGATVDSNVKDFIPGVVLRYGEISDLMSQIENYTGARVYVDVDDNIQIQPIKIPSTTNKGFKITTSPTTSDFADDTMYVDAEQDYTFSDSISKEAGYTNSSFGLLAASTVPDEDSSSVSTFFENKTVEIAQRFKPITQPNYRFYAGVELVGGSNTDSENSIRGRWRICEDDNGVPKNTNGILESRYMYPNKHYHTADGGLQVIQISKENPTEDLDENTWYWLILSSVNSSPTIYWRWYYDDTKGATHATAPPATSSATDGGTGWDINIGKQMIFFQGRFKTEPFKTLDPLAIRKRILIENVVPNFPQQIISKPGAIKYSLGLMAQTGRPRRVFEFPSVTVPNNPIFPGDVCCIIDSRFNFSTAGNRMVAGQITDINYSMGIKGGGSSPSSKGQSSLSLSVVGYPQDY